MKRLAFLFLFLGIPFALSVPEHIDNPQFKADKEPLRGIKAVSTKYSKAEWAQAKNELGPQCDKNSTWTASSKNTKIQTITLKNLTTPVKGVFKTAEVVLSKNKTNGKLFGNGIVDLSSWASLDIDRDRRIQRMVFDVEKPQKSIAEFYFTFEDSIDLNEMPPEGISTVANIQLTYHGENYKLNVPVKVAKGETDLRIYSTSDGQFTYVPDANLPNLKKLLIDCNHQFLASFVRVSWDVVLEPKC